MSGDTTAKISLLVIDYPLGGKGQPPEECGPEAVDL